ncbi:MAG: MBOAT family protein [Lachnospiraceae bacterium]|nr:MBOAT family protein [Lachnospiraceae bacterium]
MLFNSTQFLIFFPIVLLIYYLLPKKVKYIWLLLSSYFFYMCWNVKYSLLLLTSTVVTYLGGILIEKIKNTSLSDKKQAISKKAVLIVSLLINLGILFFFKYFGFFTNILSVSLGKLKINFNAPTFDIILPVGISFYTFQALGYLIDVYREDIKSEKNILKYALFVSFFPQLVAGPIERSKNLLSQLFVERKFDIEKCIDGFLIMLWGYFLKIVLADRIAIFVDTAYSDYENWSGYYLVVATILFAVQIYCDFAGYSTIAIGSAKMLGIDLMENFRAPYFSSSVAEFWRNWHISLTSWFKDYLYIPLGGSRKGAFRKYFNKIVVFLVSGLWHGAAISYIIWGGLNGLYQVIGELMEPARAKVRKLAKINKESFGYKFVGGIFTFILVDFSWIFFRAPSTKFAIEVIKSIFTASNPWILFDQSLYHCGLDRKNFTVMLVGIIILAIADVCKIKGISVIEKIRKQDYWFKCIIIPIFIWAILMFGIWGPNYEAANFIYFQF